MHNEETPLESLEDRKKWKGEHVGHGQEEEKSKTCYTKRMIEQIKCIYILASIFWLIIIYMLEIYNIKSLLMWAFVCLPLFVFAINFKNADKCNHETELEMFQGNFLAFGSLITIVLLNWNSPAVGDKGLFFKIIITAFILIMLSMIDIWASRKHLSLIKHIKSSLQTAALSLLALALFVYYITQTSERY